MRPTEPTTDAQVAAAKTLVYVAATKPTHVATAEAAHVTAAEAAAHVTGAKSSTAARVGGIGAARVPATLAMLTIEPPPSRERA